MPIECLITFDNNSKGVYYAGQELSGVVDLNVDTTKRIKAIHVTVNGYAKIRWLKKGYPHDSERAACRAYRSYLSSRSYVVGSYGSNNCIELSAGAYTYTFHIILPDNLPTSFDGKYGQIHYEIITTIDRPGRYAKVYKLPFTVIQPLDLNVDPIYKVPLTVLDRKRFWSFCCPTGPLTIKFSTSYYGYAPGQKIHFVLYINNQSSIDVLECWVKLKQEVSYETHEPQHEYRYDRYAIADNRFGNVLRWSRKVYRGCLELPSIPPTTIAKLSCPININYAIRIVIKPSEFHWKIKLKIPLIIGSKPIMDDHDTFQTRFIASYSCSRSQTHNRNRLPSVAVLDSDSNNNNSTQGQHNAALSDQFSAPHGVNETQDTLNDSVPSILVTDTDNPPDYITMLPPSYEEAMAICERFYDGSFPDVANGSLFNISWNYNKCKNFKPLYPVYYHYETPIISPETLYDNISTQVYDVVTPTDIVAIDMGIKTVDFKKIFKKLNIFRKIVS